MGRACVLFYRSFPFPSVKIFTPLANPDFIPGQSAKPLKPLDDYARLAMDAG
jgi:hypothetical protein